MINSLQIYRNDQPHLVVNIDEDTFFSHVVMGEHIISSSFVSTTPLDIDEGDYVLFRGERFNVNKTLPPLRKSANTKLEYTLNLQGYIYDLHYCAYRHLGSAEFELFATADVFIQIMIECLNNIYDGWSVGNVDVTEPKLIQFFESGKGFSCKGAIIKIAESFGLEFWLTGKTINLTAQAGVDTNITFECGRGRGLYEIVRGEIDNELYFNRLYVEGSTRNIPVGYRGGMKRLQIDVPYLQLNIPAGKRIRETSIVIEDIFPKRVGALTAVSVDWLTITDSSIDFDLNGQKIEGEKATVEMLTGENSGQSFEIDKYVHATKTIILVPNTGTNGEVRPNATFEIKPGDQYFFAGIKMPDTYIAAAEAELKAKGIEYLQKAARYVPPYSVRVSDKFMRDNGLKINAGDRVRLKDAALGIDVKIRVSAVKFSLVDPYTVELIISDVIPYTSEDKNIIEIDKGKKETVVVNKVNAEKARRNMLDIRRLQQNVFDPDGYFDPENIKPNSIETLMLSVGAKSQNFGLNSVSINANTDGNPNYLTISQGSLIHYEVQIEGLGYVWQMGAAEFPALDPDKTYFVSAKCSRNSLTGEWYVSEAPMKAESETGYYHFNIGILYPVEQGTRGFDFTNGMTFIVGDRITTGRIQSLDGLSFFDLSQNKFNVGDLLSGLDWDVTTAGQLTIRGNIVATNATFIGLVVQNIRTGKVRITADANNIRLVDEITDKIIMLLDDDSAYEGIYLSQTPPITFPGGDPDPNYLGMYIGQENGADVTYYRYIRRGPGITVGTPGTATTSLGRAGVTSSDSNGIIRQSKQLNLNTGEGRVRDDVYDGLIYDRIQNKTTGTKQSVQFKLMELNGQRYVTWDEVQPVAERMYNPNVQAGNGDHGGIGTVGPIQDFPDEPEPPVDPPATTYNDFRDLPYRVGYAIDWDKTQPSSTGAQYKSEFFDAQIVTAENGTNPGHINPGLNPGFTKFVPGTGSLRYDFEELNAIFTWAQANGKKIHYAHMLWYTSVPDHVAAIPGYNSGNEKGMLTLYIKEYFAYVWNYINTKYPGLVVSANVVNEAVNNASQGQSGSARSSIWATWFTLDELFELAFTEFTRVAPTIKRFINDYTQETSNSGQTNRYVQIINDLHAKNITVNGNPVRVDGMGFQFHSDVSKVQPAALQIVKDRFKIWVDMGLLVALTELDTTTSFPYDAEEVANWYDKIIFDAYEGTVPPAKRWAVIMWSPNDRSSHLNKDEGRNKAPGTLDADGNDIGIKNFPAMYDYYGNQKLVKTRLIERNANRILTP